MPQYSGPSTKANPLKAKFVDIDEREVVRTPSPTPSEVHILRHKARMCDWGVILNWRTYKNPRRLFALIATITFITVFALFLGFKSRISEVLEPFTEWIKHLPAGWLIPIAVLLILSFPPLIGHELVNLLCGEIYGPWIGFGIVSAGTLLGEVVNYLVFKYYCTQRGKNWERDQLQYALMAQVVREGGHLVPIVMRFSAIPSHFTTTVFATCGMSLWVFFVSALVSLPKQFAAVYIGSDDADGSDPLGQAIKYVVLAITIIITFVAVWWVNRRMDRVKGRVVANRRQFRYVPPCSRGVSSSDRPHGTLSAKRSWREPRVSALSDPPRRPLPPAPSTSTSSPEPTAPRTARATRPRACTSPYLPPTARLLPGPRRKPGAGLRPLGRSKLSSF
ncbi:snare associated Golgi protein-domain-containing protein [Epithele typhae]|uniref:snare associated Golgi protein-domain-containing protein n=1 Tax=Epithele typhae TaxID=378194 RepID=UPI002007CB2D|nr:snare associated Golgi protein-domain-containing protein [Epithele typhae]KAH9920017.1 snare associated Golgi protein-domain-containing protein [Epithele typhae]